MKSGNEAGFTRNEIGFAEQRRLFDILQERDGRSPVVIDSDDLLADPPAMVKRYCDAIGIAFIADALSWEPGERSEVLWYDGDDSIWHETLKHSDGLKAQVRDPVDVATLPAKLQDYHADFISHYRHLYRHRLRPG